MQSEIHDLVRRHWQDLRGPGRSPTRMRCLMLKGNHKSVFLVFASGCRHPVAVLKYVEDPSHQSRILNEQGALLRILRVVPEHSGPALAPAWLVHLSGGLGLLRRSAPGQPCSVAVRPLGSPVHPNDGVVRQPLRWLISFQRDSSSRLGQPDEAESREALGSHPVLGRAGRVNHPVVSASLEKLKDAYVSGRLNPVVEHGDYNPDNVFISRSSVFVTDWEWSRWPGLPLIDIFEWFAQYARTATLLGKSRSRPMSQDILLACFGRKAPLAQAVSSWAGLACSRLRIPRQLADPLLALYLAQYLDSGSFGGVLEASVYGTQWVQ